MEITERDKLKDYILKCQQLLGGVAILAMEREAKVKKDTIRNFLNGKSQNWRSDNKEKIMAAIDRMLEREKIPNPMPRTSPASNSDDPILSAIGTLVLLLANKKVSEKNLRGAFIANQKTYALRGNKHGQEVMRALIECIDGPQESFSQRVARLADPNPTH